jgi:hypothetical protein
LGKPRKEVPSQTVNALQLVQITGTRDGIGIATLPPVAMRRH